VRVTPGCKQAYPQDYAQGYKAAAFTLTHRDDGEGWCESLFALSRKIIGIDCLRLTIKEKKGRARDAPGYESRQLRDIIKAAWYLNAGSRSDLPDHLIEVLDQFKRDALAHGFE
jgi:hypothetical protein